MKTIICTSLALLWLQSGVLGAEDTYMKVSKIDGLPLQMMKAHMLDPETVFESTTIDLGEAFKDIGVPIEAGGFILYDAGGGSLMRKLTSEQHELVDYVIDGLFDYERIQDCCRAYLSILKPLKPSDRLEMVVRIGFMPDQLVAALARRIRAVRSTQLPGTDPFDPNPKPPRPLTEPERAELARLEQKLTKLIGVAVEQLERELAILGTEKPNKSE
jgi:hypothetical protein